MSTKNKTNFVQPIKRTDTADGLDAMFPPSEQPQPTATPSGDGSAPQKQKGVGKYANQKTVTDDGRKQTAFKLPQKTIQQIHVLASLEISEQWQVVADAIQAAVDKYEKENGAAAIQAAVDKYEKRKQRNAANP